MKKFLFTSIAAVLMLLASATSVFACWTWAYQAKIPKALQK